MLAVFPGQSARTDSLEQAQMEAVLAVSQAEEPAEEAQAVQDDIFARTSLTGEEARQYLETVDPEAKQDTQTALSYRFRVFGCTRCRWSQAGCLSCSTQKEFEAARKAQAKAASSESAQPVAKRPRQGE